MLNPAFIIQKVGPLVREVEKLRDHYKGKIMPDHITPLIREYNRIEKTVRIVEVKDAN